VKANPEAIRSAILGLLAARATGATVCPSQVARRLIPQHWRPLMQPVRQAAGDAEGWIEVTQGGEVVAARDSRGPIRPRCPPGKPGCDR
jgi:hypothetical protein